VDLDLDVIRMSPTAAPRVPPGVAAAPGEIFIDDEDEFAEHQVAFGYPDDVVAAAQAACADVRRWAEQSVAPFDGVAPRVWLDRVTAP
jgi:protein associated with RNAse G/E